MSFYRLEGFKGFLCEFRMYEGLLMMEVDL